MRLTNTHGISLPLAVWLLHDDYDHIHEPNYISATSLLKSTRQLVLSRRVEKSDQEVDISSFLASRIGSAIHDSQEKAWRQSGKRAMELLRYPEAIYSNIRINPTPEELAENPDILAIWIEQRAFREVRIGDVTYKIGGKFDQVIDGRLFDTKTTSVWSYILGRKDEDYANQGGIYRWLNPELITSDHIYIQFVFTDWSKMQSRTVPDYPATKAVEYPVLMPSIAETESFIVNKLTDLERYWNAPDEEIPFCTDKELWRSEPKYKYYSDPNKTDGRSTKNFDTQAEAAAFQAEKGGKGIVKTFPGEVKACDYCPAFAVCKQKDHYYVA